MSHSVLRLAKPVEHLQAALRATQTTGPLGEQITTVGRQIAYFLYLAYDAIVWANMIKFINLSPDKAQRVNKTANRYWLSGITLSIINAAFKTQRINNEIARLQQGVVDEKMGSVVDREAKLPGLRACVHLGPTSMWRTTDNYTQHPSGNQSTIRYRRAGLLDPSHCDRTREPERWDRGCMRFHHIRAFPSGAVVCLEWEEVINTLGYFV